MKDRRWNDGSVQKVYHFCQRSNILGAYLSLLSMEKWPHLRSADQLTGRQLGGRCSDIAKVVYCQLLVPPQGQLG